MNYIRCTRAVLCLGLFSLLFGSGAHAGKIPAKLGFYNNAESAPIASLIEGAQESVDLEIYEMDDPAVIGALKGALQRGVAVHIVQEPRPLGNACRVFEPKAPIDNGQQPGNGEPGDEPHHAAGAISCADQQKFVDEVNAQKGGKYVPFQKQSLCPKGKGCYEHGKIAVIDGSLALITTGNFNVSNLCDRAASPRQCDRDYSYLTQDQDIVDALSKVVEADLEGAPYDVRSLLSPSVAEKLSVGPYSMNSMVDFVQSARTSIQLENQYLKDPTLNAALMDAARRGVSVKVMVASACGFGALKPTEIKTLTGIFSAFDQAGISSRVFTKNVKVGGFNGYLHAKAIVVDGNRAWLGSVNGSTEALTQNREFGIFFDDSSDVENLNSVLSSDFGDSGGESWQDSLRCAEDH